jgi:ribosomal protein S18 acetylase RimI-like enzyme
MLDILPTADALIIAPPSSSTDYRQLASLLVSTFDAPDSADDANANDDAITKTKTNANAGAKILEKMQWMLYDKSLTEQKTYTQYTSITKQMKGKKHALFVAKEYIPPTPDNDNRASYNVVGMVEMGVTLVPISLPYDDIIDNNNDGDNDSDGSHTAGNRVGLRPQATLGVLCVSSLHRNQGIGRALVEKCEYVAEQIWNETRLFVEVEPCNEMALKFFDKYGFHGTRHGTDGGWEMRNATVSRRRKVESRPHIVLEKGF